MSLILTSSQAGQFQDLSRVLLSPLAYADVYAWCAAVSQRTKTLLQADNVNVGLLKRSIEGLEYPHPEMHYCGEVDPGFDEGLRHFVSETVAHPRLDPVFSRWAREVFARGMDVGSSTMIKDVTGMPITQSTCYNEVFVPAGVCHWWVLHPAECPGHVVLTIGYGQADRNPFGEDIVFLLKMLRPALVAGYQSLKHRQLLHEGLRSTIDSCMEAMLVYDRSGRELYRNRAAEALLATHPEGQRVLTEAALTAQRLARAAHAHTPHGQIPLGTLSVQEVQVQSARYRLRACIVPLGPGEDDEAFLITIECTVPAPLPPLPPCERLYDCFGLTRREVEVAYMLVRGLTNREIASQLFISPHTTRHHTEKVFQKMKISSRHELVIRFWQVEADMIASVCTPGQEN